MFSVALLLDGVRPRSTRVRYELVDTLLTPRDRLAGSTEVEAEVLLADGGGQLAMRGARTGATCNRSLTCFVVVLCPFFGLSSCTILDGEYACCCISCLTVL